MQYFIIYLVLNGLIMFYYREYIEFYLSEKEIQEGTTCNRFFFTLVGLLLFIPLLILATIKNWYGR